MKTKLACALASTFLILSILFVPGSWAEVKPVFRIALLHNPPGEPAYLDSTIKEIKTLLDSRFTVEFETIEIDVTNVETASAGIDVVMHNGEVDCILGLGLDISEVLANRKSFEKPSIATAILDHKLQGLPITPEGTSGVRNFNFIESSFDIEKDLRTFKSLYDFKHLAILYNSKEIIMFHTILSAFGQAVERVAPSAKLSMIEIITHQIDESFSTLPVTVDSVYLPPVFLGDKDDEQMEIIKEINKRKLPSFALLGEEEVRMGVMASIAPDRNLKAMSRRVAINVLNIASGKDPGTMPVGVTQYTDNFVANIGTFRVIDYYPDWDVLNNAKLINFESEEHWGRPVDLKMVIGEALERNLDLQIEKLNTELQHQEVGLAQSSFFPQIDLSSGLSTIDKNRADGAETSPARSTWTASGKFTQTIFLDDILANNAIQKILFESQHYQEKASLLDTVITAADGYIDLLFARSNRSIQNNNLEVTRKNLEIARNKKAVGTVDASEVYRWESEQARNQISLNDAYRDLQLARMALNQILDRPIREEFAADDIDTRNSIDLLIVDPLVYNYLENYKRLADFSDFLILESDRNLPELKQIESTLRSQEREIVNRKRALYLPDFQLQGGVDKILEEYDVARETPSELDHPWTVSATASWPLYTGGARRIDLTKSRIALRQAKLEEKNFRNQFHLQVRSNLETAAVSAREVALSKSALESATKNFEIIQAGYAEGRNTIADLIDAQNSKLSSERGEAIARYQFVLDFLILERSIGRFHFLDTQDEKRDFLIRMHKHMEASDN